MTNPELRIAVLCGGRGSEREISLISGDAVYQALLHCGLRVDKIELPSSDAEIENAIANLSCDIAFMALHGEFGEDGGAQKLLEKYAILYTGSDPRASALAMDKNATKQKLREHKIPVATDLLLEKPVAAATLIAKLGEHNLSLPIVIKPNNAGSSVGVSIVRTEAEIAAALTTAFAAANTVLVEKFLRGVELTVGVLDGLALPIVETQPAEDFYDYQAKYFKNTTTYFCPARLDATATAIIQAHAVNTWHALNLRDAARIDLIYDGDTAWVLEANTLPGMTAHSLLPKAAATAGIDFATLCQRIIEIAWKRKK